jgi:hypothetical protein
MRPAPDAPPHLHQRGDSSGCRPRNRATSACRSKQCQSSHECGVSEPPRPLCTLTTLPTLLDLHVSIESSEAHRGPRLPVHSVCPHSNLDSAPFQPQSMLEVLESWTAHSRPSHYCTTLVEQVASAYPCAAHHLGTVVTFDDERTRSADGTPLGNPIAPPAASFYPGEHNMTDTQQPI